MRIRIVAISAALTGALAACAAPPPAAPAPVASAAPMPVAAPGTGGGGLDGVYRAPAGGVHGNSACGTTAFGYSIRVVNGVASMQTVTGGRLEGRVAPDGSLAIEEGRNTLRGQFGGNEFKGVFARNSCSFALDYKK